MNSAYRISMIEDSPSDLETLQKALNRFSKQKHVDFVVDTYRNAEHFLTEYKGNSDLVFFDIELPGKNGMDGAKLLRKKDDKVAIVFVTNLAHFAIEGYQVGALDYILKPVVYERFAIKLERVLSRLQRHESKYVIAKGLESIRRIDINDILYVEVNVHTLCYHLSGGEVVEVSGMLKALEEELRDDGFAKCKSCYLVNLKYLKEIAGEEAVMVNGDRLRISRSQAKAFRDSLMEYMIKGD